MTGFALAAIVLASQVACPADVGQIRWEGYSHQFDSGGKRYVVQGTLWDSKADGIPSSGDLMKIDSATANGTALPIGELWVRVRGSLAKSMRQRFKRVKSRLTARCESRFEVQDVPRMGSPGALGKFLRMQGGTRKLKPRERAQADISGWAEEICGRGSHVEEKALEARLLDRAARRHGAVGKGHLKRMAKDTAREYAMRCAHFTKKKFTFGE